MDIVCHFVTIIYAGGVLKTGDIMAKIKKISIRSIVFPDPKNDEWEWSAVAIDIGQWAFGQTMTEAMSRLERLVQLQIAYSASKGTLDKLTSAPLQDEWLLAMWDTEAEPQRPKAKKKSQATAQSPKAWFSGEFQHAFEAVA